MNASKPGMLSQPGHELFPLRAPAHVSSSIAECHKYHSGTMQRPIEQEYSPGCKPSCIVLTVEECDTPCCNVSPLAATDIEFNAMASVTARSSPCHTDLETPDLLPQPSNACLIFLACRSNRCRALTCYTSRVFRSRMTPRYRVERHCS